MITPYFVECILLSNQSICFDNNLKLAACTLLTLNIFIINTYYHINESGGKRLGGKFLIKIEIKTGGKQSDKKTS